MGKIKSDIVAFFSWNVGALLFFLVSLLLKIQYTYQKETF